MLDQFREVFYGGAGGGGKSDALLMGALQYVDIPGYNALLFRKTYADLTLPNALLNRAKEWLAETDAEWSEREKTWHFPSGATLTFGYLDNDNDMYRYQGTQFHFIGFDELTQFKEFQYRYLFGWLRRLADETIPLRMRAASNPGGIGHDWVKQRFITEGMSQGRPFIPATVADNPSLDQKTYIESLQNLDPITRAQILNGDWNARPEGGKFRREWFKITDASPTDCKWVRYWDMAATAAKANTDPDWTAGCLLGKSANNNFYLKDMRHIRGTPQQVEALIKQTAQVDGRTVKIYMEQEPGASGKTLIDYYTRQLAGFIFYGDKPQADKTVRADPVSSQAEAGNIYLVKGNWIGTFLDEVEAFPFGPHDDQVDALSGAFAQLTGAKTFNIY